MELRKIMLKHEIKQQVLNVKSKKKDLTCRQQSNDSFKWWKRHFDKINKYQASSCNYKHSNWN